MSRAGPERRGMRRTVLRAGTSEPEPDGPGRAEAPRARDARAGAAHR